MKMGRESIKVFMRRRRILFAGFMAHTEDTRMPEYVMFGELVEGASCMGGGREKGG